MFGDGWPAHLRELSGDLAGVQALPLAKQVQNGASRRVGNGREGVFTRWHADGAPLAASCPSRPRTPGGSHPRWNNSARVPAVIGVRRAVIRDGAAQPCPTQSCSKVSSRGGSYTVTRPANRSGSSRQRPERDRARVSYPHGFVPALIVTIAAEPVPNWQFCTGRAPRARH